MTNIYFDNLALITLLVGCLFAIGAVLGRLGRFVGVPAGLFFLGVGIFVGVEGPIGFVFDDYDLTYAVGTTALGLILFHGGLNTPLDTIRRAWKPAIVLATVGVVGVTAMTGLGVWVTSESTIPVCLLLGAILGSTDAAAVFDLLSGQRIKGRAKEIIEVESGLNDPMAFVLVFGFTGAVINQDDVGINSELLWYLVQQFSIGAVVGLVSGWAWVYLLRWSARSGPGLYPVLTISAAATTIGAAMSLNGSGLLAAYLAGIVLANRNIPFRATVNRVYSTLAWGSQISMFFILGLLITPSMLFQDNYHLMISGTLLALWVVFVSRPLVVGSLLLIFKVPWRENLLICWAGLRGAVPIILATVPVLMISEARGEDISNTQLPMIFTVIFMVVVVGTIIPGALVRPVTRWLGMQGGRVREPAVELDFVTSADIGHLSKTFLVPENSRATGATLRELALPEKASVLMVLRGSEFIPPRGDTRIIAGDHVMVIYSPEVTAEVQGAFAEESQGPEQG